MKIEIKPVNSIRPYENNPRKNDHAVDKLAESIKAYGFRQPIVIDANGVIVCGHTRWKAAKQLGMKEVPCHVATDLTPEQVKAYRVADNRMSEISDWDMDSLIAEIESMTAAGIDIGPLGWDDQELQQLLGRVDFQPGTEEDQGQLDQLEPKMVTCPHCKKGFDCRGQI